MFLQIKHQSSIYQRRWYDMRSEDINFHRNQTFGRRIDHLFLPIFGPRNLIETLHRENVSFRDRDLKRQIPCHTASKNLDAQLLRNDTSFLSNLLCKSPLINYSPTIFVRLFQPIHWYETRILTFSSEKRAPISTMFTCRASHNVL